MQRAEGVQSRTLWWSILQPDVKRIHRVTLDCSEKDLHSSRCREGAQLRVIDSQRATVKQPPPPSGTTLLHH